VLPLFSEKRKDRLARLGIRIGGVLVIVVVAAIVINIGLEALPLFRPASMGPIDRIGDVPGALVAGSGPRGEIAWALGDDGVVRFPGRSDVPSIEVAAGPLVAADHEIHGLVSILGADGTLTVGRLRFRDVWNEDGRSTEVRWWPAGKPLRLEDTHLWTGVTANADEDGGLAAIAWDGLSGVDVVMWNPDDERWTRLDGGTLPRRIVTAAVAEELRTLALVTDGGGLRIFRLPDLTEMTLEGMRSPVAMVRALIGGGSLVAAGRDGSVSVLLEVPHVEVVNRGRRPITLAEVTVAEGRSAIVPDDEIGRRLASASNVELRSAPSVWKVVRELPPLSSAPIWIAPSHRRRGFLIAAEDSTVALYYSTSGRRLVDERWTGDAITTAAMAPKGDGAVVVAGGVLMRRAVHNPHPEVSLRTLFLPVWYEGYARPKWVWQSTGGSDAFEPKMSLWPLVFGTLKATLYAMIFSVPLALMAAVYVSQLAPGWFQTVVKPTVELMAAVPSVVVGFLAALWLAPRLESALFAVIISLILVPLAISAALALWRMTPPRLRRRLPEGAELIILLGAFAVGVGLVWLLAGPLENVLFGGDLQRFLFTEWGLRYDQRNSIVVGVALGFAVIPVIFTVAEDACSAVPQSLVSASRALGATRWQTAVRLVVPAASPGLFAAVMLGLGRAVGETMIVLMAAGNTPLLDLSPFNGMRTMSAAIAVEIPEAPVDSTLFRVLFLTGILLFLFTLILTTAADTVGSYLRKRYARF